MNRQKILIALDGSDFSRQILPTIRTFFAPETAELILFEAIVPTELPLFQTNLVASSGVMGGPARSGSVEYRQRQTDVEKRQYERAQAIAHQHEKALKVHAKSLERAGYRVQIHVEGGEASDQIVGHAKSAGVDLIAMATHGRSGLSKLVMGSVAERVLRESPVPVLLLRPSAG